MQEDQQLKAVLQQWAVEHPSANFTNAVMQKITAGYAVQPSTPPLPKQRIPQILLSIFILAGIALLTVSCMLPATALPLSFKVKLPATYFIQCFQFLIAFWAVMLLNIGWNKYVTKMA